MWWDPRRWSLARQVFALLTAAVLVLVTVAVATVLVQTRRTVTDAKRDEALAVAGSVAQSPDVLAALREPDPSAVLQPYAEAVRRRTGVSFVTIMTPAGIRYTHPNPNLIGQRFFGHTAPAVAGRDFTETYTGSLGPSVRAVVPVRDGGRVVALVSVGVTTRAVGREVRREVPALLAAGGLTLVVAGAGVWLLSRRLRRQTHGMSPPELTRLFEFYDAVLHSVREGLLIVDRDGTLRLANDEGRRLLGLSEADVGRPLRALDLPAPLLADLDPGPEAGPDAELIDVPRLTDERVLVVNRAAVRWQGRLLGHVVTLRDHTDLVQLSGELSTTRGLAEALRSQAHEAANRLHSVITLVELGQTERALEFATRELAAAQELTDQVVGGVRQPVLAALLLGKAAEAGERGVTLAFPDEFDVPDGAVDARDLVTVVGNLVDNGIEAALRGPGPRRVEVGAQLDDGRLRVRVANTGPALTPQDQDRMFARGWTTKDGDGHGLGLALVEQAVRRAGGVITVTSHEAGADDVSTTFEVDLPVRSAP
ncbi:ATP-binding protein [Spongisporangium articulatum]|uniref:histidine kinase n=1 Tax=Spongisporangium articulatum TaxID=3362603 RepID=A0ABW8ANI4_9ACTN